MFGVAPPAIAGGDHPGGGGQHYIRPPLNDGAITTFLTEGPMLKSSLKSPGSTNGMSARTVVRDRACFWVANLFACSIARFRPRPICLRKETSRDRNRLPTFSSGEISMTVS